MVTLPLPLPFSHCSWSWAPFSKLLFQEQTCFSSCRSLGEGGWRDCKVLTVSFAFTETKTLVLKGCSNVSISTCKFLGAENQTFRGVTFRKFECEDNSSTTIPPTQAMTTNAGSQASFTPLALASIILLSLLLWDLHPQTLPSPV